MMKSTGPAIACRYIWNPRSDAAPLQLAIRTGFLPEPSGPSQGSTIAELCRPPSVPRVDNRSWYVVTINHPVMKDSAANLGTAYGVGMVRFSEYHGHFIRQTSTVDGTAVWTTIAFGPGNSEYCER